jgi:NADH:ubiquinone oxidoreductase subunit D
MWNTLSKGISKNKVSIINFGPQHPASHGVLRMIIQLSGELIQKIDIHIGFLHRSSEYLITKTPYLKALPYFDRLDYVSMMTQEHAFCLAIEKLLGLNYLSANINMTRVLFDELTRLLNHFLAIACHALDIGSMSCIF